MAGEGAGTDAEHRGKLGRLILIKDGRVRSAWMGTLAHAPGLSEAMRMRTLRLASTADLAAAGAPAASAASLPTFVDVTLPVLALRSP